MNNTLRLTFYRFSCLSAYFPAINPSPHWHLPQHPTATPPPWRPRRPGPISRIGWVHESPYVAMIFHNTFNLSRLESIAIICHPHLLISCFLLEICPCAERIGRHGRGPVLPQLWPNTPMITWHYHPSTGLEKVLDSFVDFLGILFFVFSKFITVCVKRAYTMSTIFLMSMGGKKKLTGASTFWTESSTFFRPAGPKS